MKYWAFKRNSSKNWKDHWNSKLALKNLKASNSFRYVREDKMFKKSMIILVYIDYSRGSQSMFSVSALTLCSK